MKNTLIAMGALVLLVVVGPPVWSALFPPVLPDLPPPGEMIAVRGDAAANVLDVGSGRPVVLVHGLPGTAYDWRHLSESLVSRGFRVIAYDRLGYGHSDPRPGTSHTVQDNAAELASLIHRLELDEPIVAGWSYGGVTAMQAAFDDPSLMAGLVLVGTGGPSAADDVPPEPGLVLRILYSPPVLWWRRSVPWLSRGLMVALSDVAYSGGPQPTWWLEGLQAGFKRWDTLRTYRAEMFAEIDGDAIVFGEIMVPTLILHGDDDRLAPVAIGRYLSGVLPDVRYVEVPGGSHMLPVTHPELVANEVAGFRDDLVPDPTPR